MTEVPLTVPVNTRPFANARVSMFPVRLTVTVPDMLATLFQIAQLWRFAVPAMTLPSTLGTKQVWAASGPGGMVAASGLPVDGRGIGARREAGDEEGRDDRAHHQARR